MDLIDIREIGSASYEDLVRPSPPHDVARDRSQNGATKWMLHETGGIRVTGKRPWRITVTNGWKRRGGHKGRNSRDPRIAVKTWDHLYTIGRWLTRWSGISSTSVASRAPSRCATGSRNRARTQAPRRIVAPNCCTRGPWSDRPRSCRHSSLPIRAIDTIRCFPQCNLTHSRTHHARLHTTHTLTYTRARANERMNEQASGRSSRRYLLTECAGNQKQENTPRPPTRDMYTRMHVRLYASTISHNSRETILRSSTASERASNWSNWSFDNDDNDDDDDDCDVNCVSLSFPTNPHRFPLFSHSFSPLRVATHVGLWL